MKKALFLAVLSLAACGKKKGNDVVGGSAGSGSAVATAPVTPVGSGSAGSGSAVDPGAGSAASATGSAGSDVGQPAPAGSAAAVTPTPTPAQNAVAATGATPDVPATTDFEADAQKRITEKNLEAEVAKMEKDLGNK